MQDLDELNFNLCWIQSKKASVCSFYKENNFKPCLTKQLLNMFKLWEECFEGLDMDELYAEIVPTVHAVVYVIYDFWSWKPAILGQ